MESVLESKTSNESDKTVESAKVKAASAPVVPLRPTEEGVLKTQISAPSYFYSLKENEAPPFRKPEKEPRPHLVIGTIMSEDEAVEMVAASESEQDGLKKYLGNFLVEKNIIVRYNLSEKKFLVSLLEETISYAAQHDYSAFKLAVLFTIYLDTHLYFKWYYWQPPIAVWSYFKELMIRHTIEDSPDGQEVFAPEECYDIVSHFHTLYLTNLPLVHILTFGAYRLKFLWPFKPK